jgi:16S rRNA (uracil1498-N3)-methyltransferase
MALRRIFVESIADGRTVVTGERAHHLHRVARLRPGELVEVSDCKRAFLAEVERSRAGEVAFAIRKEINAPRPAMKIIAGLAIFKFARMELAIEKVTELGAAVIFPVAAERSDKGLVQGAFKRYERWQRIAEEAAGQSRRLAPPEVRRPVSFAEALSQAEEGLRLFLDTGSLLMKDVLAERVDAGVAAPPPEATLLIGPEGGWSDTEREAARQAGFLAVGLGEGILRAETAAMAAMAVLRHWGSG